MKKQQTSLILGRETGQLFDPENRLAEYPGWPDLAAVERARRVAAGQRGASIRASAGHLMASLHQRLSRVSTVLRRWRENRAAVAALSRLDARMLRDIDVTGGDIARLRNGEISVDAFNAERAERGNRRRERIAGGGVSPPTPRRVPVREAANQPRFRDVA